MGQEAADDIIIVHLQHLEAAAKIKDKIRLVLFTVKTSTGDKDKDYRSEETWKWIPRVAFSLLGPEF